MYCINRITILVLMLSLITGCDLIIDKAGVEYFKMSLKDTCTKDDTACVLAVEEKFDSCHLKYEDDWDRYMNSSLSEEDELLKIYSEKLYGCIVDDQGEPFFYFDPE